MWKAFLDLVYPRTCLRCGRLVANEAFPFTCRDCRRDYSWIEEPFCEACGKPLFGSVATPCRCAACRDAPPVFERARSLFLYRGTGARLIHALKYERGVWLQSEIAALVGDSCRWTAYFSGAGLVPIPLHPGRFRSRGYNQAEVVVKGLLKVCPDAVLVPCLERIRNTPSQTFLSREERFRNMHRAFVCKRPLPERRLVIVDDVQTTGATLNAAARALVDAGATDISAFTLAHG